MIEGGRRSGIPLVYLDACCLNWPFDDQTQARIRLEAEAVLLILDRVEEGEVQWLGSDILDLEIERTPDVERRTRTMLLTSLVHDSIEVGQNEVARAQELGNLGFHPFDALHLACAERAGVDVFLTTDDRLIRGASRLSNEIGIQVENPLTWVRATLEGPPWRAR